MDFSRKVPTLINTWIRIKVWIGVLLCIWGGWQSGAKKYIANCYKKKYRKHFQQEKEVQNQSLTVSLWECLRIKTRDHKEMK